VTTSFLLSALVALCTSIVLLHFLRPVAVRVGLVDRPGGRRTHEREVPLIGGLAMFLGFVFAALTLELGLTSYRGFVAAGAILVVVGVLDDLHELSSRARFGAQIAASLLMAYWGGVVLTDLGALRADGSPFVLGGWAIAFTVFCTVGVINALNMIDGLDGLAGGMSLVPLLGMAWVCHDAGLDGRLQILLLLAVVVVAFLLFNMRLPGRAGAPVFMGDAGSMFLGFAITWFFIDLSQGPGRAMAPVAALWLLLVPLFDTVWLILRRVLHGRSPFRPDFEHVHHVLQMTGLDPARSVLLLWAVSAIAAGAGLAALALGVPEHVMFQTFLGLFAAYCALMGYTWMSRRFLLWPIDRRLARGGRRAGGDRRTGERRCGRDRRARPDRRAGGPG